MLLGNYSVFNKTPGRFFAGNSQCDRSNWNTPGASRNFYYADCSAFKTSSGVIVTTHPLFTYGVNVGAVPPYSWVIPQVAGGMAMRSLAIGTITSDLIPQIPTNSAMTGSGAMSSTIIGYGNLICALTGSSTVTVAISATGNISLSATGNGALTATILGNGNVTLALTGSGNLSAGLSLFLNMLCAMTGSGTLNADAALVVSMLCAMTGDSTMTAFITGKKEMSASFTGSGSLEANINAFANMLVNLLGSGDLDADISAIAEMTIDIVVTGTGLTTANVGPAVWSAIAAQNNVAGTMGNKLNSAASAGDPWTTELPGAYAEGEAGKILSQIKTLASAIPELQTLIDELHKIQGLNPDKPVTTTQSQISTEDITIEITGDGEISTTLTRNDP